MSCLRDRERAGLAIMEALGRGAKYGDFAFHMRDQFPFAHFTDGDLNKIYAGAHVEYAERTAKIAPESGIRPDDHAFIEQVERTHGHKGAVDFINALTDEEGNSPIFDKLASWHKLTDDEETKAALALNATLPDKTPKPKSVENTARQEAMRGVRALAADLRRTASVRPGMTPLKSMLSSLRTKLGAEKFRTLRRSLAVDGQDVILHKIANNKPLNDAEEMKAGNAFAKAAEFQKPVPTNADIAKAKESLTAARSEARNAADERIAQATTMQDVIKKWAYKSMSPDTADMFKSELDRTPDDAKALSNLMRRYQPETGPQKFVALVRGGMLSGVHTLTKIVGSHITLNMLEEAKRIPASVTDSVVANYFGVDRQAAGASLSALGKASQYAVKQGIPDAFYHVVNGPHALEIKRVMDGRTDLLSQFKADNSIEGLNKEMWFGDGPGSVLLRVYANGPMRIHGGFYEVAKAFGVEQAIQEQARVAAINELRKTYPGKLAPRGLMKERTAYYRANPSVPMVTNAIHAANELTLLNKNKLNDFHRNMIHGATQHLGEVVGAGVELTAPFMRVPSNVAGKVLDYGAGGIHSAFIGGKVVNMARKSPAMSGGMKAAIADVLRQNPQMQRQFADSIGRNVLGAGLGHASLIGLGYTLANAGLLKPDYNVDPHDKNQGKVKVFGKWVQIENWGPGGTELVLGASLSHEYKSPHHDYTAVGISSVADHPYMRNASDAAKLVTGSAKERQKVINYRVQSIVPAGVQELAKLIHPHKVRDDSVSDALMGAIPGLRNMLPDVGP